MSDSQMLDHERLLGEMERLKEENALLRARLELEEAGGAGSNLPESHIPIQTPDGGAGVWEQLLQASFDLLYLKDDQARYMWVNQAFCRFFQKDREHYLGRGAWDIFPPEKAEKFHKEDMRALAGETVVSRHVYVEGEKEYLIRIQRQPIMAGDGRVLGILCVARDETGIRDAERALEEIKRSYDTLFHNALVGVFRTTPEGRFLAANPALATIFGYDSPKELIDSIADIGTELYVDKGERERYLEQLHQHKGAPGFEARIRRKDGSIIWVLFNTHLVYGHEGEVLALEGMGMDITAMRQAKEELHKAKEAAEDANQTKSRFLANMSHELRTPLNGAMGMLQLLKSGSLNKEQSAYVKNALTCCSNLTRLLGDVLDLSKVEAGVIALEETPFDPGRMLDDIKAAFADTRAQGGINLSVERGESVPGKVMGDGDRLRQILSNLVGNALKHTPGGEVSVSLYRLPDPGPQLHRLLCVVSDTGQGIPLEVLEQMFEPFTQGDSSLTRRSQGAGLGLHIVKRLVDIMGGTLAVDTEEGQGVSVYVSLPFGRAKKQAAPGKAAQEAGTGKKAMAVTRVLVAEDDRVNQLAVLRFLDKLGISAKCVADGQAAIRALQNEDFDCVLMDIQMPILDGVEATRRIRSGGAAPGKEDIPIIALTACAMTGDRDRLLGEGINSYLSKPVEFGSLATALSSIKC